MHYEIYSHMQVKRFNQELPIPTILPSPGAFQGAQFNFDELLTKLAKEEIYTYVYIAIHRIYHPMRDSIRILQVIVNISYTPVQVATIYLRQG